MITPKTDWTRYDFESVEDFNRQTYNIWYIATFVLPLLGLQPPHNTIGAVDTATTPLASLLNSLEDNIWEIEHSLTLAYPEAVLTIQQTPISGKAVVGRVFNLPARIPLLGDWKPRKTWTPEGVAPDFTDTNRWENNMKLVHDWAKVHPIILSIKPSGTFAAGQINFLPRMVI